MVIHIVLLEFASHVDQTQIYEVLESLGNLRHSFIPEIKEFNYGINSSPEGMSQHYQYGFTMKFSSTKERDHYLNHPQHIEIAERIRSMLANGTESAVIVDYEFN